MNANIIKTDQDLRASRLLMIMAGLLTLSLPAIGMSLGDREDMNSVKHLATIVGTISGPYPCRNLQIFLVHGETQLDERRYATLAEALEKGLLVVKETGNVQELTIENRSKDVSVFLNAGDIVKGGRQDRTVQDDLILPPLSGPLPLKTFCVESGRWTKRGAEDAMAFSASSKALSSRQQKVAARYERDQTRVWSGVAQQQYMLSESVSALAGKPVEIRSNASPSSLQLTLENKELDAVKKEYLQALKNIINGKPDVIGFAFAINGKINSAEVYNHKNLFRALWPKLLDAAMTEAIAEYRADRKFQPVETPTLMKFFELAISGSITDRSVSQSTSVKTYTTATMVLFETLAMDFDRVWIHRSFISK